MQVRPAIARSMITGRKSGLREFGWGKDYSLSFNGGTAESSLTPRATICSAPSGSGRCSFRASSGVYVEQSLQKSGPITFIGLCTKANELFFSEAELHYSSLNKYSYKKFCSAGGNIALTVSLPSDFFVAEYSFRESVS
jgi:hypothetical protein